MQQELKEEFEQLDAGAARISDMGDKVEEKSERISKVKKDFEMQDATLPVEKQREKDVNYSIPVTEPRQAVVEKVDEKLEDTSLPGLIGSGLSFVGETVGDLLGINPTEEDLAAAEAKAAIAAEEAKKVGSYRGYSLGSVS